MATSSQFRCAVDGAEALARLRDAPLPNRLKSSLAERSFHRDIFLDTSDRALAAKGVVCRLRIRADDHRTLTLVIGGSADRPPQRWDAEVPELDARRALEGASEPARRLRGLVDPTLLKPRIEVETERWTRIASSGWLRSKPRMVFLYDHSTVRHAGLSRSFEELQVRRVSDGGPHLDQVAVELERLHGLRPLLVPQAERAAQLAEAMATESTARMLLSQRAVALVAYDSGGIAFLADGDGLLLPVAQGSGEETCRHLLRHVFGSGVGDLTLLGQTPAAGDRPGVEVWAARRIRGAADGSPPREIVWLPLAEALGMVGTPTFRSPETVSALALAARADLAPEPPAASPAPAQRKSKKTKTARFVESGQPGDHFFNVELSQLAFHQRVLELAEDPAIPLAERLRYLAITSSNLDEFFSVRVGALKAQASASTDKRSLDGRLAGEQLDAIAARAPTLVARQGATARAVLQQTAAAGVRVRAWNDLDADQRSALGRHFQSELLPVLTPRAVTLSPGHPVPIVPHLSLAFAVLVRDIHTGPVHFAYLPISPRLARFVVVPGTNDLVPIEEVVRANLQVFYPERPVEQAWLFRVTRGADLDVNEEDAGDLLQAIEEEVKRRPMSAPVRVEVERGTPLLVQELILKELRFERRAAAVALSAADLYEVDGLLDLTALRDVAAKLPGTHSYPAATGREPFAAEPDVFRMIDEGDRLVHHPFEDFGSTVQRFLEEAARDPDVVSIKMTLYRTGDSSPVVDALVAAAKAGKDVAVFVEIKARFDETKNAKGVKRLEAAGAQVIYGLVGLKIHAKVALVVRQSPTGLRRYLHVGTGNYHAATARFYTDLGLFTSDPEFTADAVDLFNQLTGSTHEPSGTFRRLLVSPVSTVPELLKRIDREIAHVAAGRGGRIRAQLNGLEDPEMIGALYRASEAGVTVELIIRGLCALRPRLPGLSGNIRVRSVLGRYLEHQRIVHFGNGGADDYLIGSADWRPRNLRRRVEVMAPVIRRDLKARLGTILDRMWAEPAGWELGPEGEYRRPVPEPEHRHVHEALSGD